MQHHGAPTRLLDFTNSLFIALYFATLETKTNSAIWCVNQLHIRDSIHQNFHLNYQKGVHLKDVINDLHIELANKIIAKSESDDENKIGSIIPLEPNFYTERLSRQQGLFLMPTNSNLTFLENLAFSFKKKQAIFKTIKFKTLINLSRKHRIHSPIHIVKIIVPNDIHSRINRYLKEMNITAEILFPGIDGLAKSLIQSYIRI